MKFSAKMDRLKQLIAQRGIFVTCCYFKW